MKLTRFLNDSNSLSQLERLPSIFNTPLNVYIASNLNEIVNDPAALPIELCKAVLAATAPSLPMIPVRGGKVPTRSESEIGDEWVNRNPHLMSGTTVEDFEIGKYPVTVEEWNGVSHWASLNGFDLMPIEAKANNHPASASWYCAVKWCNAKSLIEGLKPVYGISGQEEYYSSSDFGRNGSTNIVMLAETNGYRLPTEAEWEWAAIGGRKSRNYTWAGSNRADDVAWHLDNLQGETTHAVGEKDANELGLYDMSGNESEWCWDFWDVYQQRVDFRVNRGGDGSRGACMCKVYSRGLGDPTSKGGLRLVR